MIPWTEKYRPRKLREVAGQLEAQKRIVDFIKNFSAQGKKAILIYGPTGTGKTAIIHALASDLGYEVVELNASNFRSKKQIQEVIGQAMKQQSLFSKGKVMLVDEVDSITGTRDRGGLQELLRLIEQATYPIVITANDVWQAKLRPLRSKTQFVEFKALDKESLVSLLQRIAKKEKLKVSCEALGAVSVVAQGDARAAITDLQALAELCKSKEITKKNVAELYSREKDENIFQALRFIFKSRGNVLSIFDNVQNIDTDDLFLWLDENLPLEYQGNELAKAYDALSKADVFRGRIRRWQHWRFLIYVMALLTEGIANSKKESRQGFTSYKPPSRILKIWLAKQKLAKKKSIAEKYAKATHTSKKRAIKEFPYFELFFKHSKQPTLTALTEELKLSEDERAYLNV